MCYILAEALILHDQIGPGSLNNSSINAPAQPEIVEQEPAQVAPKRGRPPGSKNKSTLERNTKKAKLK